MRVKQNIITQIYDIIEEVGQFNIKDLEIDCKGVEIKKGKHLEIAEEFCNTYAIVRKNDPKKDKYVAFIIDYKDMQIEELTQILEVVINWKHYFKTNNFVKKDTKIIGRLSLGQSVSI